MNTGELLVIILVALIVFGPKKLPMVATHMGILMRKLQQIKAQALLLWKQQQNEWQLQENQRKAEEADELYKQ